MAAHIYIDSDAARRLKIYAADQGLSVGKLGTRILVEWLDKQPPVGGRQQVQKKKCAMA